MTIHPRYLPFAFSLMLMAPATMGQDPVIVDPAHYRLEFENDRVRVLRIKYGPGEKGKMHAHPNGVVIFLTDANQRFHNSAGESRKRAGKAGDVIWLNAQMHRAENLADEPLELIVVELKDSARQ